MDGGGGASSPWYIDGNRTPRRDGSGVALQYVPTPESSQSVRIVSMRDPADNPRSEPGLYLYWVDKKPGEKMKPGEEGATWWGQLAGSMHRLASVREELEALRMQRHVERAMRRLESQVESYLFRVYQLRERALRLLASRTHQKKDIIRELERPKRRNYALSRLKPIAPELTDAVEHLLSLLDDDIGLRNKHTHDFYLNLGLYTGSDIYDPYDALLDVSEKPASRRELETLLRREVKKTAQRYVHKVEALLEAVKKVLEAGHPVLPR
jgi:hypothetical protein